jgi:hypothetical protein
MHRRLQLRLATSATALSLCASQRHARHQLGAHQTLLVTPPLLLLTTQLQLQQQPISQLQQLQPLLLQSTALVAGACSQSAQDAAAMALLAMLVMSWLRPLLVHLLGLVLPAVPALGMQAAVTSRGAGWVTGLLRLLQETLQQLRKAQAFSSSAVSHAAQARLRVQQQMGLLLGTAMQVAPLRLWPGLAQMQGRLLRL